MIKYNLVTVKINVCIKFPSSFSCFLSLLNVNKFQLVYNQFCFKIAYIIINNIYIQL